MLVIEWRMYKQYTLMILTLMRLSLVMDLCLYIENLRMTILKISATWQVNHLIITVIIQKIGKDQPHQGVIALVHSIFKNKIEDLHFEQDEDRVVILDQVSDPQNIGAIIRSAAAFGINKLILPSYNSPDENATIAKAACGCLELMQIIKVPNLKNAIDKLKKMDFWIAGLDVDGKKGVSEILDIKKIAIIIGSEGKGMRKLTVDNCDFLIKIPIAKQVESLNASNAASIIFYLLQNKI